MSRVWLLGVLSLAPAATFSVPARSHPSTLTATSARRAAPIAVLETPVVEQFLQQASLLADLPAFRAMEHEFVALLAVAIAVNAAFLSKGFKSSARSATPFDAAVRAKAAQALEAAENSDEELWQRVTEDLCDLGHRTTEASGNMYCLQLQREGRLEWVCV